MATKTARYANFYRRENKLQPSSCSSGTTWQKEIPILSRMITRRLPCHSLQAASLYLRPLRRLVDDSR
jgi:hypothetical protein